MNTPSGLTSYSMDAIVLAGGAGRRMGGADKAGVMVAGRPMLERVLTALRDAGRIVVVGDRRRTARPVEWTREEPPGGGPVAALAAGLGSMAAELVAVMAVDLPLLGHDDVAALVAAAASRDGAIFVDGEGRDQPLAGVYRSEALRAALDHVSEHSGASVHALTSGLDLARITGDRAALDCDTPPDVERAESILQGGE